jgi:hypothetical protein
MPACVVSEEVIVNMIGRGVTFLLRRRNGREMGEQRNPQGNSGGGGDRESASRPTRSDTQVVQDADWPPLSKGRSILRAGRHTALARVQYHFVLERNKCET